MTSPLKKIAAIGAICTFLFSAAPAQAVVMVFDDITEFLAVVTNIQVEDFEGVPWDPPGFKPNPLGHDGLLWSSANYLFVTNQVANSAALSVLDFDSFDSNTDLTDLLSVNLAAGVSAVGIYVSTGGQNHGVIIQAYDAAGTMLVDAVSAPTGFNEFDFLGFVSSTGIFRVDFVSATGPSEDDFALDDFHYGTWEQDSGTPSTITEPAGLALIGGSLVLLGFVARRRRQ